MGVISGDIWEREVICQHVLIATNQQAFSPHHPGKCCTESWYNIWTTQKQNQLPGEGNRGIYHGLCDAVTNIVLLVQREVLQWQCRKGIAVKNFQYEKSCVVFILLLDSFLFFFWILVIVLVPGYIVVILLENPPSAILRVLTVFHIYIEHLL